MGLHSCEQMKIRDKLRKEDASYLVEYVRKIFDARSDELIERVDGCMYDLPIYDDGEISQVLHIVKPEDGSIRDASFVIDGYSSEGDRQFYEFSMSEELSMNIDQGSSYKEVSLQDDDQYRAALRDVSQMLLSTGVETPETTPAEEEAFWDIALETCYEDMGDDVERMLWEKVSSSEPTRHLKELLDNLEKTREAFEMALGIQAVTSVFSVQAATRAEVSRLYWRRAYHRHVGSKYR